MEKTCLVLTQSRGQSQYNDKVGRTYHFPRKYINQFDTLPIEFIYYEPKRTGNGEYFGYGKITEPPIEDKREKDLYFVEIADYKTFSKPVGSIDFLGKNLEEKSPHYNAQNAVRKIPKTLLDEICLDGKILLNFKADAHLIKVLGEQLIASEKVGILELIKNAYDAGSSYCRVRIENIPSLPPMDKTEYLFPELPGPVIIIEDDGCGMTREVIENGWLRPASIMKTVVKHNIRKERETAAKLGKLGAYNNLISEIRKERGGRIPLGEKGVGRFAAGRLGRKLILKTKVAELEYEYLLAVNWDEFDLTEGAIDLESIGIELTRQQPSREYGAKNSGTQLLIYGSREGFLWDEPTILDLHRSISSLNSPYPSPKIDQQELGFKAFLECPQLDLPKISNPVDDFPSIFSFDGLVDENGLIDFILKFQPPNSIPMSNEEFRENGIDLRKAKLDYWTGKEGGKLRTPKCGMFYLHVDVWYRTSPWVTGLDGGEFIKNTLTPFGGISIFRDGINVFPAEWGAETDWLGLSNRHIKQGYRMSYYNMIGNLEIDQVNNIDLTDKTDREGLIENTAFKDLSQLVQSIIVAIIEIKFIGKRDEYSKLIENVIRDPKILADFAKQGMNLVNEIKGKYPIEDDPYEILGVVGNRGERNEKLVNLADSLKNLQKSIELIKETQDLLTEQAGFGMAVAVSIHEIAKITANFYSGISYLIKSDTYDKKNLEKLKGSSESLQSELKRLSPIRAIKNENPIEFGIIKPIDYVLEMFKSRIENKKIKVEINFQDNFNVFGRYGTIIQIFSNFFDNSCYWLGVVPTERRKIEIHINPRKRTVIFADSGPGIDQIIFPYLFQPGYSLRIPPSGLGLYICRYYMQSMKGQVYLTNEKERIKELKGAQFTLDFSKVLSERKIGEEKK